MQLQWASQFLMQDIHFELEFDTKSKIPMLCSILFFSLWNIHRKISITSLHKEELKTMASANIINYEIP